MNPQILPQHQASYQTQLPQQHQHQHQQQQQNINQQRQLSNGFQQNQGLGQQKSPQALQPYHNPYANYDPQLALFTLEKPKTAKSWEDVEPEQQHVTLQDLQNELNKFRRNRGSVKRALNEITSANCRRLINELVEDQTKELWKYNKTLQYRIASVEVEWRSINRRERMLKRVQVILETEPSGFQDTTLMRANSFNTGNNYAAHDPNKAPKQNSMPQIQQFQGQTVNPAQFLAQQPRSNLPHQPHPMGQMQHLDQQPMRIPPPPNQGHGGAPPPPPPPAQAQGFGQSAGGAPPPPPPASQYPSLQSFAPGRAMPGTFPEPIQIPLPGLRQGQVPPFETMDRAFLREQKSRHKDRHSSSSSSSESDWESDSNESSSICIQDLTDEPVEYNVAGQRRRGRSRHSTKSKRSQRLRSQSKMRSRSQSRSRSRPPVIVEPYREKSRRRRNSTVYDRSPSGKYSPVSSSPTSPRSSRPEIPPIHIHMNTNNTTEDMRERRTSMVTSPTSFYKHKRITEKIDTGEPMSREGSWDRASGTASFGASSGYTAEDVVFDAPIRRLSLSHSHGHGRTKSYSRPQQEGFHHSRPSHDLYDDMDRRPMMKHSLPDNYPHPITTTSPHHIRESYFDEHAFATSTSATRPPLPHRRNSVQVPTTNPFASAHFPTKPLRAMSYTTDVLDAGYSFPPRRAIADRAISDRAVSEHEERIHLQDVADALEHIKESRRVPPPLRLKRRPTDVRASSGAVYSGDEWDARSYPVPGPRRTATYSEYSY